MSDKTKWTYGAFNTVTSVRTQQSLPTSLASQVPGLASKEENLVCQGEPDSAGDSWLVSLPRLPVTKCGSIPAYRVITGL